ncbi:SMC-Scp complex subunit ScpB [Alphaproteobacteria bacterium]|nr:SMC-Scp complex subunit ScpB [Alphaproteobacteria bacterium]MDA8622511.1 SMC-Scp complex subunit ScpB [bacterium]MDA8544569.1 SMC-Scp complex subunit ScpB [Alphaproteobacteria bacterium]MDA8779727.1 SMC-Scp complex subunit ScpB [Alphaproteobacteria bacterium]MDB2406760.1 SMC-Scp complex subunit ScpB [Alphaproteobacteria bacterium]
MSEDDNKPVELRPVEAEDIRIVEAVLFAAEEPLDAPNIADKLAANADVPAIMQALGEKYAEAGFNLQKTGNKWVFRSAPDLAHALQKHVVQQRRLSRAALETLAIIAYHQPVTRAEIENIRGVSISKGTLDVLLESEWVKIRGRRRVPGRPVTYGTSDNFLLHFGLEGLSDLPGLEELKAAGLLDDRLPPGFEVPAPDPDNDPEEDPLEAGDDGGELAPLEMDLPEDIGEENAEDAAGDSASA